MKKCEKCDNEHDGSFGSGRFCSISCSNSKPHSFETKQKISKSLQQHKQRYCASCIMKIKHKKRKYCKECKKYYLNTQLFEKLKIIETNLQIANQLAVDKLKKIYFVELMSLPEIFIKYGIRFNTVYFFLKKNGIKLRSLSKANKLAIKKGRKIPSSGNSIYKHGWHSTWYGGEVYLRSSYEYILAEKLDDNQIYYEVEKLRIQYQHPTKGTCTYIPDFHIPALNMIIETKGGYFYERDKEELEFKKNAVIDNGYLYTILVGKSQVDNFKI